MIKRRSLISGDTNQDSRNRDTNGNSDSNQPQYQSSSSRNKPQKRVVISLKHKPKEKKRFLVPFDIDWNQFLRGFPPPARPTRSAEGRVILADALYEASSERPQIIVDFATLTGAGRVALGPDIPALFCNNDKMAEKILAASFANDDPLWRMPLWQGYVEKIKGKYADLNNAPESSFGGAITAALFLEQFVGGNISWAHIDLMAWNPASRAGRPEGGEAMGLRAIYSWLYEEFVI